MALANPSLSQEGISRGFQLHKSENGGNIINGTNTTELPSEPALSQVLCTYQFIYHPCILQGRHHNHSHFREEETEKQRGWVTCPRSHSSQAAEVVFKVRLCGFRPNLGIPAAFKPISFCLSLDGLVLPSFSFSFKRSYWRSSWAQAVSWLHARETVDEQHIHTHTEAPSDLLGLTV